MKKILLLFIFMLSIVGCNNKIYYWEFNYSYEEVNQIKIIEIIDESDYKEIQEIDLDLVEEIYNDIINIEMKRYGTNLSSPSGKCILIVFNNGDYDIISKKESKHFKYDNGEMLGINSWLCCEESEFENLINKYLKNG